MVDSKRGRDISTDEVLSFFQIIATLTPQEKAIIHDLPDHFRRTILHFKKTTVLSNALKQVIKQKYWTNQQRVEISSLIAQTLADLDTKKGIITTEVYEEYGLSRYRPLLNEEKEALNNLAVLTLDRFAHLSKISHYQSRSPRLKKNIAAISQRLNLAYKHEKIALSLDTHIQNLLDTFRQLLQFYQSILIQEKEILTKLKIYETKSTLALDIPQLRTLTDRFIEETKQLKNIQLRIKNEFYVPFQKYNDQKVTSLDIINNLLDQKPQKWYHTLGFKQPKINLPEVLLEYHTMTTPEEVLEFFSQLELIPQFLDPQVTYFIKDTKPKVIEKMRSTRKSFERSLWEKRFDSLTGAYTKSIYFEEFQKLSFQYERTKQQFSLLIFDIDYFKQFNDTYGHATGDKILQTMAKTIMHHIRKTDIFIRYGGEEFILLLPNTSKSQAITVAEKLRIILPTENPQPLNPKTNQPITVSIGVATYPEDCKKNSTAQELLENADKALYTAKREGRNRVVSA